MAESFISHAPINTRSALLYTSLASVAFLLIDEYWCQSFLCCEINIFETSYRSERLSILFEHNSGSGISEIEWDFTVPFYIFVKQFSSGNYNTLTSMWISNSNEVTNTSDATKTPKTNHVCANLPITTWTWSCSEMLPHENNKTTSEFNKIPCIGDALQLSWHDQPCRDRRDKLNWIMTDWNWTGSLAQSTRKGACVCASKVLMGVI